MGMRQYSAKMFFFSLFANLPSFLKKLDLFIVATVLRVNNHSSVYLNIGFFSATKKYIYSMKPGLGSKQRGYLGTD